MTRFRQLPSRAILASLVVLTSVVGGCAGPGDLSDDGADGQRQVADLVLTNGRIVTLDEQRTEVAAMAMANGRIVALGSDEEMAPHIGDGTERIDLAGRLATPGFIEGHGHFLSLGESLTTLDLTTANSWREIVDQVAAAVATSEPGEWIRGRGWHQEKWDQPPESAVDGSPVHDGLSAVSPDNPVLLGHASGHAAFANQKALELAGISAATPNPQGGELVRRADGRLTGLLRETAQRLVMAAFQTERDKESVEERSARLHHWVELAGEEALRHGVTSFHDAGTSFEMIDELKRFEEQGALPIRLYVMARFADLAEFEQRLPQYRTTSDGDDYLVVRSIKRQIDGALGAHGAWLLEPYEDLPSSIGLVLETEEEVLETARLALRFGYQLNTHAIGDRANRRVLDLYEQAFGELPEGSEAAVDHRWRIEHAQHLHPDDVGRFAELGIIASMQGVHCSSDGPWVPRRIGDERAEQGAYLWRTLLDLGVVINNGTDVPVESIDPMPSFRASVTRETATGERFYPEQVMNRDEALYSYTAANAYAAFEEQHKGTLEVGKLADVVVLSHDILAVPDEQLTEARVDYTILGGKVRYRGNE